MDQLNYKIYKPTITIMSLSSPLTVIGMINGMIGGFILILPVNALHAGWVFSLLVITIIGAFSYYSCYLCVIHLGDQKDLDYAMYVHFNKSRIIKIIYDLTVFSNLLFLGFLYFELICIQWEGIVGKESIANPLANTAVLFILIFLLKYFQFGASIMAYGIISIIGYVIFLIWVISTTPGGDNHWPAFGSGQVDLAAAMGGAFSIQTFFIPVLKRNLNPQKYTFFTLLAYIAGSAIYMYIAFVGGFGILQRQPIVDDPQTIEQYFPTGKFQVKIIQAIYLIHLYSVFPEFTLISKKRLFSIFRLKETQKGKIPIPQIIYAAIFVGICLLIRLLKVKINEIVDLNGSVIGFFFIYFLPSILHIRCLYFSKNKISSRDLAKLQDNTNDSVIVTTRKTAAIQKVEMSEYRKSNDIDIRQDKTIEVPLANQENQMLDFKRLDSANQTVKPFRQSHYQTSFKKHQESPLSKFIDQTDEETSFFVCDCKKPQSKIMQALELLLLFGMIGIGGFILVNGLMTA